MRQKEIIIRRKSLAQYLSIPEPVERGDASEMTIYHVKMKYY